MKRKVILIAAAGALCGLLAVGGTLAWFTDSGEVVNEITVGNMNLTLTEPEWDEDDAKNVVPGATLEKDPTVTNTGSVAAFVKITVTPGFENASLWTSVIRYHIKDVGEFKTLSALATYWNNTANHQNSAIEYNGETYIPSAKVNDNGILEIYTALKENENIQIFDQVHFEGNEMGNDYRNAKLDIKIKFDAVQIENYKPDNIKKQENGNIKIEDVFSASDLGFETVEDPNNNVNNQGNGENTDNPVDPNGQGETQ